TKGLSTLNSMAFGLAVYASQCGSPTPYARLASGRWSGATGRAFHPQDSAERFPSCFLTSHPPFPSFLSQSHPPKEYVTSAQPAWDRHAESQAGTTGPKGLAAHLPPRHVVSINGNSDKREKSNFTV